MAKSNKPRPVPLGSALGRPDEALEDLATISLSDIEDARALQRRHAPVPYATVLDPNTEVEGE